MSVTGNTTGANWWSTMYHCLHLHMDTFIVLSVPCWTLPACVIDQPLCAHTGLNLRYMAHRTITNSSNSNCSLKVVTSTSLGAISLELQLTTHWPSLQRTRSDGLSTTTIPPMVYVDRLSCDLSSRGYHLFDCIHGKLVELLENSCTSSSIHLVSNLISTHWFIVYNVPRWWWWFTCTFTLDPRAYQNTISNDCNQTSLLWTLNHLIYDLIVANVMIGLCWVMVLLWNNSILTPCQCYHLWA